MLVLNTNALVPGSFKQQCMDRLTNFILADAVETASPTATSLTTSCEVTDVRNPSSAQGAQRHLGLVMIPGKHLVSVQRIGQLRGDGVM